MKYILLAIAALTLFSAQAELFIPDNGRYDCVSSRLDKKVAEINHYNEVVEIFGLDETISFLSNGNPMQFQRLRRSDDQTITLENAASIASEYKFGDLKVEVFVQSPRENNQFKLQDTYIISKSFMNGFSISKNNTPTWSCKLY